MRAPEFWRHNGLLPRLLTPFAAVYTVAGGLRRRLARPRRAAVPVICVGNAIAGGAGKTPVAIAIAERLKRKSLAVAFLTRGYGGSLRGPLRVDPGRHAFGQVGDEALLLAAHAPTYISRNRVQGARRAAVEGARIIIMDDGFQNPSLQKDLSLLVIDAGYGFGNGRVLPAGPLREPLRDAFARADAAILIGEDRHRIASALPPSLPLLRTSLVPLPPAFDRARPVFAFAGIGRPEKFFETLRGLGLTLAETASFPDHHPYRTTEIEQLLARAQALGATLVTTYKDWVRLPETVRGKISVVNVEAVFSATNELDRLLNDIAIG